MQLDAVEGKVREAKFYASEGGDEKSDII